MDPVEKILKQLDQSRVLIVGMAKSGVSAAKVLRQRGATVFGTDRKESIAEAEELLKSGIKLFLGKDHPELVPEADLVVLSPGVPLEAALPVEAKRLGVPVVGELELAHRLRPVPMLAITGTNGKSTTTALCAHLLQHCGFEVFAGGNLGRPLGELCLSQTMVDWAVVEVSSFQLEHLTTPQAFVPQAAIWLNLTPDHLDRHGTMQNYTGFKRRLFEGQGKKEAGIFFLDDPVITKTLPGLECRVLGFSRERSRIGSGGCWISGRELRPQGLGNSEISYRLNSEKLAGNHNAENAAAAVIAALLAGADLKGIQGGLDSYPGLPHRIELVRVLDGVRYVNDSKGTNVDATAKSLTSFEQPLILIAGGRGKGSDYQMLRPLVSQRVKHLILIGEEADNLARDLAGCTETHRATSMEDAVKLARSLADVGDVVLLSPACASFDMFSDYTHRGRVFSELVNSLEEKDSFKARSPKVR